MASSNMIYTLSDWQISSLSAYFRFTYHPDELKRISIEYIGIVDDGYLIIEYIQNGHLEMYKIPREPNQTPNDWKFKPEINPYE